MSAGTGPLLITGATGFVGTWVLDDLRRRRPDAEVWATSDRPTPPPGHRGPYRQLDLADAAGIRALIRDCRPGGVLHLAGAIAGADVAHLTAVNAGGSERLYRALAEELPAGSVRVVQASSAAVYGPVPGVELPVSEERPLRPVTPYAISKAAQERVAVAAGEDDGLQLVRARIFNLLGPRQPEHLVPMCFLAQLREIRRGEAPARLLVGNLSARRDFVDVRDVVQALLALLDRGAAGAAYNVASGDEVEIGAVLTRLQAIAGLDVPVEVDPTRLGAGGEDRSRADVSRIAEETGWRAAISLDASLRDMWETPRQG
jgi:GDP-4-dehydro-6-deoxy-D-mannose reductase